MLAAGITNSDEYDVIAAFNNAADSVSQGVDFKAAYEMGNAAGQTEFKFDLSHVETHITPNGRGFVLSQQTLYNLAMQTPKTKAILSVRHRIEDWKVMLNTIYYGPFSAHNGNDTTSYSSKYVTNLEANYAPSNAKAWTFGLGVGNLLNTMAHYQNSLSIGSPYISENPFEYQGRNYYLRAKYLF
jgi:hypothetical protein